MVCGVGLVVVVFLVQPVFGIVYVSSVFLLFAVVCWLMWVDR